MVVSGESGAFFSVNGGAAPGDGLRAVAAEPAQPPETIDAGFAPRPRQSVAWHRFDDEVLVVDGETGRIHVLNSVAAVVWECFDGEVTLDELAGELAEAYRVPRETVIADTLGMARRLGELKLLAGIAPLMPDTPRVPGLREVDELIGPVSLMTQDGDRVTVPRDGSQSTLLVNWSPSCGYCVKIVDDLAWYRPQLIERGVDLVLMTVGSVEDNRLLLDPAGLSDAAFYRNPADGSEHAEDPFGSQGTPIAYLLDSEGRVLLPAALGSNEVPNLVRHAAGLPPESTTQPGAQTTGGGGADKEQGRRRRLPAGGMCGSSASSTKPPRQWASTSKYVIGEYDVGIRADSPDTEELLSRAFGSYRAEDDLMTPANYSVVLGGGESKALSLLLEADTTVVRSRSPRRVFRALQAHLSALLDKEDPGLLSTNTVAALVGTKAVLLPTGAIRADNLQPRLARLGVRLSDQPHALVDPLTNELVIPEPGIEIDNDVLQELGELPASRSELPPMEPGRYPLAAWAVVQDAVGSEAPSSRAAVVAALLPVVNGTPDQLRELIASISQVVDAIPVVHLQATSASDLMNQIERRLLPVGNATDHLVQ